MPRSGRPAVCLALAAVLAVGGCSGAPDEAASSSASPTGSPSASRWKPGEFTTDHDVCGAISADTVRKLRLKKSALDRNFTRCVWAGTEDDVSHMFTVNRLRYAPPEPRPDYSATDEARHAFARPRGWDFGEGVAVRGLGDQAKITGSVADGEWNHQVRLAVRVRNLILLFDMKMGTSEVHNRARVVPFGELRAGVLAAAREAVAALGVPVRPAPTVPPTAAYRPGEVRSAHPVCGSLDAAQRLIPGARRYDLSPSGTDLGRGCLWEWPDGDVSDKLTIDVEVVPPGPAGAPSATRSARSVASGWRPSGSHKRKRGLGDQALVFRFGQDRLHDVSVSVRRGNLLVFVGYKKWDTAATTVSMEKDVTRIAEAVLHDNR